MDAFEIKCSVCKGTGDCPTCHGACTEDPMYVGCDCRCTGKCFACGGDGKVSFPVRQELPWLGPRIILLTVHGSRAYGTHTAESDYDFKGVVVPPAQYRDGFMFQFAQAEYKGGDTAEDPDAVLYGVLKFFKLAADCNPTLIEVLWSDDDSRLLCTPAGQLMVDARESFLSRKALHTFRGYAMSQLKRIKTHRRWLMGDVTDEEPTRAEFGLVSAVTDRHMDTVKAAMAAIRKRIDSWEIDFEDMDEAGKIHVQEQIAVFLSEIEVGRDEKFRIAGKLLGYDDNFMLLLEKERAYKRAHQEWKQYCKWKEERNETRAALEAAHGYDTKHAMHLVRLMTMCREILTEGIVHVRRPDADFLNSIRNGDWDFDKLMEWAEVQDKKLVEVSMSSPLPKRPPRVKLDELCRKVVRSVHDEWDQ